MVVGYHTKVFLLDMYAVICKLFREHLRHAVAILGMQLHMPWGICFSIQCITVAASNI